jgi:hypothetical protein
MVKKFLILLLLWPLLLHAQEMIYEIRDFSGGMVTDFDLNNMERKYGSFCYNFDIDEGNLKIRKTYSTFVDFTDPGGVILNIYKYTISEPNLFGTPTKPDSGLMDFSDSVCTNGEIFVIHNRFADGGNEVEGFWMYPHYNVGVDTILGDGSWYDPGESSWAIDYNDPANAPGRTTRLRSSGLQDFVVTHNVLRMSAGAQRDDTTYTYPWWFGYIGRYFWRAYYRVVDDFFLYESSLSRPDTAVIDCVKTVANTTPSGPDGVDLDVGRYWIQIVYEYDGYQYSMPRRNANWYADIASDNQIIQIITSIDTTSINNRVTALIVFSSNPVGVEEVYYNTGAKTTFYNPQSGWPSKNVVKTVIGTEGIDWKSLPYFYRKRVVISDNDTTALGYVWKDGASNEYQYAWMPYYSTYLNTVYIDHDDMDATAPDMWNFLGHGSNEIIALPQYMAEIGGQMWTGNVLIDGKEGNSDPQVESKIHQRYSNMILVSPFGKYDVLPVNNFILVGGASGSYITGIKEWSGNALVWTNDAVEIWAPGEPPMRLNQFKGMGCLAPESIQITPYGVFWANADAIYHYMGSGIPQPITSLIETVYDSLNVIEGTSGLSTLRYATSSYFAADQQYVFVCDTIYTSRADTSLSNTWGNLEPPRIWGGQQALVYNIPYQSWCKWRFNNNPLSHFITGWDNRVYALLVGGLQCVEMQKKYPNSDTDYSAMWRSGWTDFGHPGIEKELQGIQLDYELPVETAADTLEPDSTKITVYVDGSNDIYDEFLFYASDSLTLGGSNWRRVQYVESDSSANVIYDPSRRHPVLFDIQIEIQGDLAQHYPWYYSNQDYSKVNAIRFIYKLIERRK